MIPSLVKQTISAVAGGGTGNLTLSTAVSPYATLGDVFGGNRVVRYSVYESGVGFEIGYGTYTHSGTTFSRDTIQITWNGTTWDDSSPAALTFTTAAEFGIPADASTFMSSPMGHASPTRITSAHLTQSAGSKNFPMTANRQYAAPFWLREVTRVSQLAIFCDTGVDATTSELGISQLIDGYSHSSYIASASVDLTTTSNATVVTANITDVTLYPGWYMTHVTSTGAATVHGTSADQDELQAPLALINTTDRAMPAASYTKNGVGGTLDADPSSVTNVSSSAAFPVIYLVV